MNHNIKWVLTTIHHYLNILLSKWRYIVGGILVILAFWFGTPPGLPPDDVINIFVGDILSQVLNISLVWGIFLTYTIVPISILYLACVILPGSTDKLFNGYIMKFINFIKSIMFNWKRLLVCLIIFYILITLYINYMMSYIHIVLGVV